MSRLLFDWLETLPASSTIRDSTWMFAVADTTHLLALVIVTGAVLTVDLRLIGYGFRERPVAQVARDAEPWLIAGLAGMVLSGILMIMGNGDRYYDSNVFWNKMRLLLLAGVFTFTVRRILTRGAPNRLSPVAARTLGVVSVILWVLVAIAGRVIGLE
jgi:hypothetical protein